MILDPPHRKSASHGGRVLAAQEDAEIALPRSDVGVMRAGHRGEDLRRVVEIVDRPRGEELAKRDLAQHGVNAVSGEICLRDQPGKSFEALAAKSREPVEQLVERRIHVTVDVGEAVEAVERQRRPVLDDPLRPIDVVVHLGTDQMPDDVLRLPPTLDVVRIEDDFGREGTFTP